QNDVTLKMPAFEWVHVQLHQQKGMISLSPPTICNSAIRISYNLFLLFKFDSLDSSEYRQQIKTFRLKYVFLAAKIIKTARYVIMKLSENYPYKGVYEKCLV
ncbi:hypothetical protein ACWJTJ_29005, partial [Klebsiella pneumoniae]|nr:hypothetical protein [Salmonella enterica subsp. enterica serovar Enteritidis]MCV2418927.1 hypothetical protein [Escherichia coli]MDK9116006.1 hypothetical protein [Salmonella enterica subsp. enterica serovar Indiana]MDY9949900.1 hypothetical protein [Klebsiella pneumoniae]MCV5383260.1 hypothetical protein [Escherichia coli]